MNMLLGLIGYGAFVFAIISIGIVGYWKADQLEAWTKKESHHTEKESCLARRGLDDG